ncbi:hypothetical protein SDC9_176708 [bioreactor metagenome]|uniref:Uncharacterized protein n=1 Tax=bioreactor metagenome TaxID=1076179 RepID=A0A645GQT8_9ZZZZ
MEQAADFGRIPQRCTRRGNIAFIELGGKLIQADLRFCVLFKQAAKDGYLRLLPNKNLCMNPAMRYRLSAQPIGGNAAHTPPLLNPGVEIVCNALLEGFTLQLGEHHDD